MEVVHSRCAGVDISKKDAKVCVRVAGAGRRQTVETVTTWGSMTTQILALRDHLVGQHVTCVLRHWWPAAVVGATFSRNVRRAVASAPLVDAAIALSERGRAAGGVSVSTIAVGRRLDDAAYGAGLWWGVIKSRSFTALMPRSPGSGAKRSHDGVWRVGEAT